MAERSNATSKKNQEAAQDVGALQKRGRRRLLGAIALVLLAVIVLPMVFDPEPKPNAPAVSIRIPSEEGTKFTPKVAPKPAPPQIEPPKAEEKASEPAPVLPPSARKPEPVKSAAAPSNAGVKVAEKAIAKPAAKAPDTRPVEKPAQAPAAKAAGNLTPAVASAPAGEKFVVQVGAYASPEKVKEVVEILKDAKVPHFTESVATAGGTVTRVRIGPFDSKEAAEKARERVTSLGRAKGLGLNPAGPVLK